MTRVTLTQDTERAGHGKPGSTENTRGCGTRRPGPQAPPSLPDEQQPGPGRGRRHGGPQGPPTHGPKDEDTCSEPGGEPQNSKRPDPQNQRAGGADLSKPGPAGGERAPPSAAGKDHMAAVNR